MGKEKTKQSRGDLNEQSLKNFSEKEKLLNISKKEENDQKVKEKQVLNAPAQKIQEEEENKPMNNMIAPQPNSINDPIFYPEFTDSLPLIIKAYPFKSALSKQIAEVEIGQKYLLEGPIGRGLEISDSFSGEMVMIGAGTGILPFIDLLDLLLKKILFQAANVKKADTSYILPAQDYSKIFPGAKFKLLSAFRTMEDFIGWEWIGKAHRVSKNYDLGVFETVARVRTEQNIGMPSTKAHFDKEFLSRFISKSTDFVLICGPPKMNKGMFDIVKELVENEDRIVFV